MPTYDLTAAAGGTWRLGDRVVNRMGFGSMRLTVNPDRAVAIQVLRRAVELGVNHIDTAAFYYSPGGILGVGSGAIRYANELIRGAGAVPGRSGHRNEGRARGGSRDRLRRGDKPRRAARQVEENLRRLGRDHLDVVNLRIVKRPGRDSVAEQFAALAELRDAGLIRHLGLSNVRLDHLDEARRSRLSSACRTATRSTSTAPTTSLVTRAASGASRSYRSSPSRAAGARQARPPSTAEAVRAVATAPRRDAAAGTAGVDPAPRATRTGDPGYGRPGPPGGEHRRRHAAAHSGRTGPARLTRSSTVFGQPGDCRCWVV